MLQSASSKSRVLPPESKAVVLTDDKPDESGSDENGKRSAREEMRLSRFSRSVIDSVVWATGASEPALSLVTASSIAKYVMKLLSSADQDACNPVTLSAVLRLCLRLDVRLTGKLRADTVASVTEALFVERAASGDPSEQARLRVVFAHVGPESTGLADWLHSASNDVFCCFVASALELGPSAALDAATSAVPRLTSIQRGNSVLSSFADDLLLLLARKRTVDEYRSRLVRAASPLPQVSSDLIAAYALCPSNWNDDVSEAVSALMQTADDQNSRLRDGHVAALAQ